MKICKKCNKEVDPIIKIMPETSIHYARSMCPICNAFIDWIKKPENEGTRTQSSKYTLESLSKEYCELCGRIKDKLGKRSSLEIHHKIPIEENGEDTKENILVLCTACHRMAHFLRTYLHKHLDDFYSFYNENRK